MPSDCVVKSQVSVIFANGVDKDARCDVSEAFQSVGFSDCALVHQNLVIQEYIVRRAEERSIYEWRTRVVLSAASRDKFLNGATAVELHCGFPSASIDGTCIEH